MSFDTLAPHYRGMERLLAGGLMQRCRTAHLREAAQARNALLLGEGPGRFVTALLQASPRVRITCVEQSPAMIAAARARLAGPEQRRVEFVAADALSWQPAQGGFDLVVTHFFLDCFRREEVAALVARTARQASPRAQWLLADFCEPASGWRRWRARMILRLLYAFFRRTTGLSASWLTPPDEFLAAAGFRLARRQSVSFGLVHSDLWLREAA